ncbi:MAG: hypothetical protein M1820_009079 [Bogoriella megaspora]|nr:MAG: hypothetical protein M1820_009079 [Bogoriella megaspora]
MPSFLETIPYEVLLLITQRIPRKTDVRSFCQTCKSIYAIAARVLYEEFFIDLDKSKPPWLRAFANDMNPGVPFIKTVVVFGGEQDSEGFNIDVRGRLARAMWSFPINRLRGFRHDNGRSFKPELYLNLLAHQRNIKHVYADPMCALLNSKTYPLIRSVEHLQIDVWDEDLHQPKGEQAENQERPSFSQLKLLQFGYNGDESPSNLLGERLVELCINRCLQFTGRQGTNLNWLYLDNIPLEGNIEAWTSAINFSNLERLEITRCYGMHGLIRALTTHFSEGDSKLKGLTLLEEVGAAGVNDDSEEEHRSRKRNDLKALLDTLSGLQELSLCLGILDRQLTSYIFEKHGTSLKQIVFDELTAGLNRSRVGLMPYPIIKAPLQQLAAHLNHSLSAADVRENELLFSEIYRLAYHFPQLRTLRLLDMLHCWLAFRIDIYEHQRQCISIHYEDPQDLQYAANRIFEIFEAVAVMEGRQSRLQIVAFAPSFTSTLFGLSKRDQAFYFLKDNVQHIRGGLLEAECTLSRKPWEIRCHEQESNILEWPSRDITPG